MASPLILVANPGSASRKYGVFQNGSERASVHVEHDGHGLVGHIIVRGKKEDFTPTSNQLEDVSGELLNTLKSHHVLDADEKIDAIGLRLVAPSSFFLGDYVIDEAILKRVQELEHVAPLHIKATLGEYEHLSGDFDQTPIVLVSDSAFHKTKPDYAWNYGIKLDDADKYDVKRFGYHGLSVEACVRSLSKLGKLTPRMVVCHLGSGSSVTAVFNGKSIDTSMGYSPLEGLVMSTRSGTIDYEAVLALKRSLKLNDDEMEEYLYTKSGLLGLGKSDDIRTLIENEANGDHQANLALATFAHTIRKQIGGMITAMNGIDALIFTGTVGERSSTLRKRIVSHLQYVDIHLDGDVNEMTLQPDTITNIAQIPQSKPILVVPTNEAQEIAEHVSAVLNRSEN